ncbi:hypothetical protein [Paractinoplanes deccanensis]|nr:hypothetical protein [Actinoplanes deccanensis]
MTDVLSAAVRNNAEWCALVCRTHGIDSRFAANVWRSLGPTPQYYPDAVTLTAQASAADVLPRRDPSGCSVKDSFATVDLGPEGFEQLFAAQWIHRPASAPAPVAAPRVTRVSTAAALAVWSTAWGSGDVFRPALLEEPDIAVLAFGEAQGNGDRVGEGDDGGRAGRSRGLRGGAVLNRAAGVVGVSNLFAAGPADAGAVWAGTVRAAGEIFPGVDLVGYEHGDDLGPALAAGFAGIGWLRVWAYSGS